MCYATRYMNRPTVPNLKRLNKFVDPLQYVHFIPVLMFLLSILAKTNSSVRVRLSPEEF